MVPSQTEGKGRWVLSRSVERDGEERWAPYLLPLPSRAFDRIRTSEIFMQLRRPALLFGGVTSQQSGRGVGLFTQLRCADLYPFFPPHLCDAANSENEASDHRFSEEGAPRWPIAAGPVPPDRRAPLPPVAPVRATRNRLPYRLRSQQLTD